METVVFVVILVSHALAAWPGLRRIRSDKWPRAVDFACFSILLFYGSGLLAEMMGLYESKFFAGLLSSIDGSLSLSSLTLLAAPWALRLASHATCGHLRDLPLRARVDIRTSRRPFALLALIGLSLSIAGYSCLYYLSAPSVWQARHNIGEDWGPLIIVFYLPLHVFVFYLSAQGLRDRIGRLAALLLALAGSVALLPIGQRTLVLLPFLLLALFWKKLSVKGLVAASLGAMVLAAVLLPIFKWQFSALDTNTADYILVTLQSDVSRAGVLREAIERSEMIGTNVFPYSMAGYVYASAFFVPRGLAPWKGFSTAQYFTAAIVGSDVNLTNWGFGLGLIEEIVLNAGLVAILPGLLIYGACMGGLDRLSVRHPTLAIPARFGMLWIGGYHLPALLLLYGSMALVIIGLERMCIRRAACFSGGGQTLCHQQ